MDITIDRRHITERILHAKDRLAYQERQASMIRSEGDYAAACWYDGAAYSTKLEIDTLEIMLEVADDTANNVYSIAQ